MKEYRIDIIKNGSKRTAYAKGLKEARKIAPVKLRYNYNVKCFYGLNLAPEVVEAWVREV